MSSFRLYTIYIFHIWQTNRKRSCITKLLFDIINAFDDSLNTRGRRYIRDKGEKAQKIVFKSFLYSFSMHIINQFYVILARFEEFEEANGYGQWTPLAEIILEDYLYFHGPDEEKDSDGKLIYISHL